MVALQNNIIAQPCRMTAREYLVRERIAETKNEFHGGVVVAMAGADPEHSAVVFDLSVALGAQLRYRQYRGFARNLRVRIPACDRYYYPDVVVVSGELHHEELEGMRSLLNPTLIVEVHSDATERADRGEKWICYQTIASLQSYVLVSQTRALIEVYRRQANGWLYTATVGVESVASLETIGCELRLTDVYAHVPLQPFPPQSA